MVNVYWDDTAVDPVVILGVIPGGQIFQLWSATDSNSLRESLIKDIEGDPD